jgi:pyruvate dehydrogenase E2 component (dihydrolipoamide acetyltransferase)
MNEIRLPQLGQSVEEASILQWFKEEGETVTEGDPLFSVQTDKAEFEVESTATGVLRKVLVGTDSWIPVLTVVALVGEADEILPDLDQYAGAVSAAANESPTEATAERATAVDQATPAPVTTVAGTVAISPRASQRAMALGVDVSKIHGTGPGGRVLEGDVLAAGQSVDSSGPDAARRTPLTPMRQLIAERLSESVRTAPHFYVTVEVDMTNCVAFKKSASEAKITYNDILLYASTQALKESPAVNSRWAGDAIEELDVVNIGFAVALESGLLVPVVAGAERLSLAGISAESKALVEKARSNKLLADDCQGSTFTLSNLGAFGVDQFTAIINQPNSAILAVGQMKDQPVAIDGQVVVRPMMKLTLSADHRVIDGANAAQFLGRIKGLLEEAAFDSA